MNGQDNSGFSFPLISWQKYWLCVIFRIFFFSTKGHFKLSLQINMMKRCMKYIWIFALDVNCWSSFSACSALNTHGRTSNGCNSHFWVCVVDGIEAGVGRKLHWKNPDQIVLCEKLTQLGRMSGLRKCIIFFFFFPPLKGIFLPSSVCGISVYETQAQCLCDSSVFWSLCPLFRRKFHS